MPVRAGSEMTDGSGSAQSRNNLAARRVFEGESGKWSRSRRWRREPRQSASNLSDRRRRMSMGEEGSVRWAVRRWD